MKEITSPVHRSTLDWNKRSSTLRSSSVTANAYLCDRLCIGSLKFEISLKLKCNFNKRIRKTGIEPVTSRV